ncbi:MAG: GspH/FimT family pseudopilin [Nevskiaceae bacterium]
MRRGSAGFTMLELMTVITVLAILAAIALPGFGYLAANTKVKGASTELYLALIRARAESVKRNRGVAVVAASGDEDNWQAGWQIIADGNNDGDFADVASDDDRLIAEQGELQRVTIMMATDTLVFRPTGRLSDAAPSTAQPAFDVASSDPNHALRRCVSADLTGRPYIRQEACP